MLRTTISALRQKLDVHSERKCHIMLEPGADIVSESSHQHSHARCTFFYRCRWAA